jgi:hypothetical protein
MQVNAPTLTPAPSGKYSGIPDYIAHAIHVSGGSAKSLAKVLGLTTGSRISDWRSGAGVPGVLMALRLAKVTGDDPVDVLTMAGHADVVEVLRDVWAGGAINPTASKLARVEAQSTLDHAINLLQLAKKAVQE